MIALIKLSLIYILRGVLHIFYLLPLKQDKIVFCAYNGKSISCNPKYINNYLLENKGSKYKYIWVLNQLDEQEKTPEFKDKISVVKNGSFAFFKEALTCKVYITNGIAPTYLPFRKKQCVIGTWHGGGAYKKGGVQVTKTKLSIRIMQLAAENATYVLSSSKRFSEILQESFLVPNEKIIACGMPRNDIMFKSTEKVKKKVRQYFDLPIDSKLILYAPTFRSDMGSVETGFRSGDYGINEMEILEALNSKFGGSWYFLFRAHYYLPDMKLDNIINTTQYPDMQELLLASDILLNDYSSSMWDFSHKPEGSPCFLYADDWKYYEENRGFETPIKEWPFPLAEDNNQLVDKIYKFDKQTYLYNVKRHHDSLGSYENGTACARVCELIENFDKRNIKVTKSE